MSERARAVEKYKRMILALPVDEYAKLVDAAQRQTREPEQQAYHYIRRALSRQTTPKERTVNVT
ncbi:MAG TPA: hypothetical protein VGR16_00945 [Thermomicrobiales bacterium]|nr:hypothetical protein [Thermomicrobiales bacterium]